MKSLNFMKEDTLAWLMESESPGVRYLAQRDLLELSRDDPVLKESLTLAHQSGPIATVLNNMSADGYWVRPGPGYNPKYRSGVWALTLLAQLGASIDQDERIRQACDYMLDHGLTSSGQFTMTGSPSGTIDCLQGNLCWALQELGCDDPRLVTAFDWMARSVTGEGISPASDKEAEVRYYAYNCGPIFACGGNSNLPCAWGAVKVMLAFSKLPIEKRTPSIIRAIEKGIDFLFSTDPAGAEYPARVKGKPNRSWWKFGFPVFYVTDVLQNVEALVGLRFGADPRLANAMKIIRDKQDKNGRWPLEYDYNGKTWVDFGLQKQPNKWVTLRVLRVLKEFSKSQ
jgi:hypothetical protein